MVTVLGSTAQNSTARASLPGMLGDHVRQTRSAHSPPVTAPTSHCPDCGAPQLGDLLLEELGHPEEEGKTESPRPEGMSVQHRRRWLDDIPVTWFLFLRPPSSDSSQVPPVCPHSLSITSCLCVFLLFSLSPAAPLFVSLLLHHFLTF